MILSALIQKDGLRKLATLTLATPATNEPLMEESVANVATVAVANSDNEALVLVDVPPSQFSRSALALRADEVRFMDDRRHCSACANLSAGRCLAAWRGEIQAARHYRPIDDLPRRCEGYMPKANESDQRIGKQRWPGLASLAERQNNMIEAQYQRTQ
ncbi:hypothetical protein [Methylobacter sp. BBA5.1]|uniref:hypothetical protein n=1 Tax=Methylobacter sp. BBA5.1 TaxID=1495064 RepID=UPI00055E5AE6|nr:hypothetical protein [Methylobacter sp. BBA5.1]